MIRDATTTGENTIPAIVKAVKADVTIGEIMGVFEAEYGSYSEGSTVA